MLRRSLKLSNDECDAIADIARWTHRLLTNDRPGVALMKRFLARPQAASAQRLLDAMEQVGIASEIIAALRPQLDALSAGEVAPPPLLTGDMLVAAGYRPGPAFKRVLEAVYDSQLEGFVVRSEQALDQARLMLDEVQASAR